MANAIPFTSCKAGHLVHTSAPLPTTPTVYAAAGQPPAIDPVQRQAAIENALSMALFFVRQPGGTPANLWAATARTNRALTLLKHASDGRAA